MAGKSVEEVYGTFGIDAFVLPYYRFHQKYPELKNLLSRAIQEGSADFLGEMISGETINPEQKSYGDQHESELWLQLQTEMNGPSIKNWMDNGLTARDKPTDLGYYMGAKGHSREWAVNPCEL